MGLPTKGDKPLLSLPHQSPNTALEPRCFVSAMSYICIAIIIVYLLFIPPYSPVDPDTTTAEVVVFDYVFDDRTPTVELPGKQSHFPSPYISYIFHTFLALGI